MSTCVSCEWSNLGSDDVDIFIRQHSLFSPNCSKFEKQADFRTSGFVKSEAYTPLTRRAFFEQSSMGRILCFISQPKMHEGVESVQLLLFWLITSSINMAVLHKLVQKLEEDLQIKFIVPLRQKGLLRRNYINDIT